MKSRMANKPISIFYRPRALVPAYINVGTPTFGQVPKKGTWIENTQTGVPHYGMMWAFYNPGANALTITGKIQYTYYLKFKTVI